MKISWIIPVFNAGQFLLEAVRSIVDTSPVGVDNEVILIDDCSTDQDTILSLSEFERFPFVKILYQSENGGPARARNRGIMAATGEWLAFLDADDVVAPDSLNARIAFIKQDRNVRWIVGDMLEVREIGQCIHLKNFQKAAVDGILIHDDIFKISDPLRKIVSWGMLPFLGAMMIRRDLLEECGPLSEELVYGEDIHFCLVLASLADMYWINRPVFHLRRYHESMTKNHLRAAREAPRASRFCLRDPRLKAVKKEMRWHYAANLRQSSGVFLQSGKRLQSMFYAARALFWSPNDMRSLRAFYRSCVP